jgi:hypothetical protein
MSNHLFTPPRIQSAVPGSFPLSRGLQPFVPKLLILLCVLGGYPSLVFSWLGGIIRDGVAFFNR